MISILMPVKNAEPFLVECLDSIVNQSIKDWELIAIDDHSTDESPMTLKAYSDRDSRIRVYANNDTGIISALNQAYGAANGNFITRMDADDIMVEDKLELLLRALEGQPNGVSTAKVKYFSEAELGEGYLNYENWLNELVDLGNGAHYDHIYTECVIPSPCWMMSRNTLDKIGKFADLEYPEDYDLCFKMYLHKLPIVSVNKVLHHWRDYQKRTSRNSPNYADNTFIPLKLKYFLKCDRKVDSQLILWGAGKKGKRIAQLLVNNQVDFDWHTNNPNKIGHSIYGKVLKSDLAIDSSLKSQIIIAIADKKANEHITKMIQGSKNGQCFKFC